MGMGVNLSVISFADRILTKSYKYFYILEDSFTSKFDIIPSLFGHCATKNIGNNIGYTLQLIPYHYSVSLEIYQIGSPGNS